MTRPQKGVVLCVVGADCQARPSLNLLQFPHLQKRQMRFPSVSMCRKKRVLCLPRQHANHTWSSGSYTSCLKTSRFLALYEK